LSDFEIIFKPEIDEPDNQGEGRFTAEDGLEERIQDRIALVIGVERYDDPKIQDLRFTEEDANRVKDVLRKKGMFTLLYMLTVPRSPIPPTRENIIRGLKAVAEYSKEQTIKTFVFYYAGHGFHKDGVNYMVAKDTSLDSIEQTGISLKEAMSILGDIHRDTKVMVFMDACRSLYRIRGGPELWKDEESSGIKILYSSSMGMPSFEIPKLRHGLYTKYLLEALEGEADKPPYGIKDGLVSFSEVSRYITDKLMEWSKENPLYKQEPRIDMQEAMGDFFITTTQED
jgi:hypothetical protein